MPRVIITAPNRTPQPYRFQLDRQKVQIGRGSENDIVLDCSSVSVRHAMMERIEGGYQLRDLGSTNGIKLDGDLESLIPLRHGLSVKIGDVAFDFTLSDEEREALNREKPMEESPLIREEESSLSAPPAPKAPPAPRRAVASSKAPSSMASFLMTLLFLTLALAAFWIGLEVRHQKDTGKSLLREMRAGSSDAAKPLNSEPAPK
ncbi:MAG: FHA domain-containing protein [Verrucomicrobia bacterium]|nr:MAG: FHA domain-containing protein [Verrucomicrobiota bacterium]TAE86582.1 MAG: FHA domain-containing protein [Verrucomicrobiota bacterium]TAF24275.1 MAG: FHA domain-containing protein [Verrucomicrobiota bacterium]TAF40329.1 MAG: FHA domain-containing protein [Verrucomicrobiota bacterium]